MTRNWNKTSSMLARVAVLAVALLVGSRPSARGEQPTAADVAARVAAQVEELRGLRFLRPVPVEVIDADTAVRLLLERITSFQPREQIDKTYRVYELLGLLPSGFDLFGAVAEWMRGDVGGFYDPESGSFFVIDRGTVSKQPLIIAHELTHALEDQHFDIDARLREAMDDDDRLLAQAAVREGSAMLLTSAMARTDAAADLGFDAAARAGADGSDESDEGVDLPPVLLRQFLAPYVLGPRFLAAGASQDAGTTDYPVAAVDRAWRDPPVSTEQILHPDKYWAKTTRDVPRPVDLGKAGRALGRGFDRTMHGTLGELTLGTLVGARPSSGGAGEWSVSGASGWDGDGWELWQRDGSSVVLLGTLWDSPRDALEFVESLPADAALSWRVRGDAAAVVAGDAGPRTDRVLERMLRHLAGPLVRER